MKKILTALILGLATVSFFSVSTPAYSQISKKKKIIKKNNSFKKKRSTIGIKGHSKFGKSIILKKKLDYLDDKYYRDQYYKYGNDYYKYDRFKGKGFGGHSKFGGRRSFGGRSGFGTGRLGGFTGFDGSRRSSSDRGFNRRSGRRSDRR